MYNTLIIIGFLLVTGAISLADSADQSLTEFSGEETDMVIIYIVECASKIIIFTCFVLQIQLKYTLWLMNQGN